MEQSKDIKQNWARIKNFDICFCVTFDFLYLKGRLGTRLNLHLILIFSKYFQSRSATREASFLQCFCTRYQAPLYLWQIESILKF